MAKELSYSINGERYCDLESIKDNIASNNQVGDVLTIFIGENEDIPSASDFVPDVVELMGEAAGDEYGECAEDYVDCTKEQGEELQSAILKLVDEWADKHKLQPRFWNVGNTKEVAIRVTDKEGNWEEVPHGGA